MQTKQITIEQAAERQGVITPLFGCRKKRASEALRHAIDAAARTILDDPLVGEPKQGGLKGVRVYKFTHQGLTYLLAYSLQMRRRQVQFLTVGPHENFYRDLQKSL